MSDKTEETGLGASAWGLWSTLKSQAAKVETSVGTYLADAPQNVAIKDKLSEWGQQAGKLLDAADERIGELEKDAKGYLTNLSTDIQHFIEHQGTPEPQGTKELFVAEVPSSRLDNDLKSLLNEDLYVEPFNDAAVDPPTNIDASVASLHSSLVPSKLTDNQFWNKYNELKSQVLAKDEQRKKILEQPQEEEDEGWGSSGEE